MVKYRELERLHPYSSNWTIHVKCLRMWTEFHPRYGRSIELILGDEERTKIHASIPFEEFYRFEDDLKEGGTYVIHKFRVKYAKEEIQKTDLGLRMFFTYKTWLEHSETPIESNLFSNTSFKKVLDGNIHSRYPYVDVLGAISKMGEIRSFEDDNSPKRWELKNRNIKFTITDSDGLEIDCFASGVYANEMFNRFKMSCHTVNLCLFKLWKVIKIGDAYQLTNGNGISDIIVDPKFKDFEDYISIFDFTGIGRQSIASFQSKEKRYEMDFSDHLASFIHPFVEDNFGNHRIPK